MSTTTESAFAPTEPEEPRRRFPLVDFHRSHGAHLLPYRGLEAPAFYQDAAEEYEALRNGCGLVDRSWTESLVMHGEDRARFLGGLVTCDAKSLASGQGAYGFVTTVKGRVMADLTVLAAADHLWLELSPGTAAAVAAHLQKYVIVDRVEIAVVEDQIPLTLIGPKSSELLALDELPEKPLEHLATEVLGTAVRLVREPSLGVDTWTLWVAVDDAPSLIERWVEGGTANGFRLVGHQAYDRLRVEAGVALLGVDFDAANFPQETGLEDLAVSYTKGCYLGQEIVARIHYRGGVNRHLRGLTFAADLEVSNADLIGRSLSVDGREVGSVTSVAETTAGRVGLAILHQRAEPDAVVDLADGGTARVIELPFAEFRGRIS